MLGSRQVRGRKRGAGGKGRDGALSWPGIDHGNPEVPYYNPQPPSLIVFTKNKLQWLPFVVAKFTFFIFAKFLRQWPADGLAVCLIYRSRTSNR